jgi:hypothetical protein
LEIGGLRIALTYARAEVGQEPVQLPEPYPLFAGQAETWDIGIEVEVVAAQDPPALDPALEHLRQSARERFSELFQDVGFVADYGWAVDNLLGLFDACLGSERFQQVWGAAAEDPIRYAAYGILGQSLILLDHPGRRAWVFIPSGRLRSYALVYLTQTSVKMVYALLLESFEGILVHASGVALNGKAYLFAGASGVGKTWVAQRLADRAVVLADDAVAVRWDGEVFRAFATPWNLDFPRRSDRRMVARQGVPLAGICFLEQSDRDVALPLPVEVAGAGLLAQVIPLLRWFDAVQAQHLLDLSIGLCQQATCCSLALTRHSDIWRLIQKVDKVSDDPKFMP